MYYIFESRIRGWGSRSLLADSEPTIEDCEPHWWLAQPLTKRPERFKFFVPKKAKFVDNYACGTGIDMYSRRLVELLATFPIRFEAFPADVLDEVSGEKLDVDYLAFHLLEIYPAVDFARSDLVLGPDYPSSIVAVRRLVLTEEILQAGHLLFRPAELFAFVLIHEDLKQTLDRHKITGCNYVPLGEFKVGLQ
ncbi:hypothetical protein [Meiothermus sp. CFH 77666]|uniref:imm11 family protein n=1 Tax=Meiothermus sp. CFH 77666 TaxID=2817942 RepID=UPI001AA08583|nr:hypothetical protein [Meiothermus sp. CFH 77666]MBO1435894.1 hypothetical protein [Meiothermus sp. CFH 77666]